MSVSASELVRRDLGNHRYDVVAGRIFHILQRRAFDALGEQGAACENNESGSDQDFFHDVSFPRGRGP